MIPKVQGGEGGRRVEWGEKGQSGGEDKYSGQYNFQEGEKVIKHGTNRGFEQERHNLL